MNTKLILLICVLCSTGLFAEIKGGKFAVGFAYAGNIGPVNTNNKSPVTMNMPTVNVLYHFTETIGLAASAGFYMTNYKDKSGLNTSGYGTWDEYQTIAWGASVEVPFYLARWNALRFYLAPGGSYTPARTTQNRTDVSAAGATTRAGYPVSSTNHYVSGYAAIGLQLEITEQLHLLGRTTVGYAMGIYTGANQDSSEMYIGLQSWSLGALFYFN